MFIRTLDELEKLGRISFPVHSDMFRSDIHLLSVFCPPLVGNEQHDKDGALGPSGPVPPGPPGY